MSRQDKQRQKPSVKGFLAWVNADEELDDEAKIEFNDEYFDEVEDEEETIEHKVTPLHSNNQVFHSTPSGEKVKLEDNWEDWNEEELAAIKADDSTLVDYEGDDEFDYPDEISVPIVQEAVHMTKKEKRRLGRFRVFYLALSAIVALNVIGVLLLTVNFLPPFGGADNPAVNEVYTRYVVDSVEETGALNIVSAVLYSYRSFDTLGEAFVLFTAAVGVIMLLQETKETKRSKNDNSKD